MEIKGNYLHLRLRRTNKEVPYHENISPDLYPLQNQEYLNQVVNVVIKDNYRIFRDDVPDYWKISDPQVITMPCRVIRFDAEAPWVAVYLSLNYEFVVTDSSKNPSEYPLIYSIQYSKDESDIIGVYGTIQSGHIFNDRILDTFDFKGVVVKSDIIFQTYATIFLPTTGTSFPTTQH